MKLAITTVFLLLSLTANAENNDTLIKRNTYIDALRLAEIYSRANDKNIRDVYFKADQIIDDYNLVRDSNIFFKQFNDALILQNTIAAENRKIIVKRLNIFVFL